MGLIEAGAALVTVMTNATNPVLNADDFTVSMIKGGIKTIDPVPIVCFFDTTLNGAASVSASGLLNLVKPVANTPGSCWV